MKDAVVNANKILDEMSEVSGVEVPDEERGACLAELGGLILFACGLLGVENTKKIYHWIMDEAKGNDDVSTTE